MTITELKKICEALEAEGKGEYKAGMMGTVTGGFYEFGGFWVEVDPIKQTGHWDLEKTHRVSDKARVVEFGECGE